MVHRLLVAALAGSSSLAAAQICALTDKKPGQARYLKFCQDYNIDACCIPGHDLENQLQFENLIAGLGPGCKNPMMYPEVRYFYCLGCDPKQPDYTVGNDLRVCKSFLDKMWSDPTFEECGVMKSNECPESWGENGFDPYTCGDDLELPKNTYDNATMFINQYKPPGLEFNFIQHDDSNGDNDCWSPPAFRSSAALRTASSTLLAAALAISAAVALR